VLTKIECRRVADGTGADDHNTHLALSARLPSRPISDKRIRVPGMLNYIASRQLTLIPKLSVVSLLKGDAALRRSDPLAISVQLAWSMAKWQAWPRSRRAPASLRIGTTITAWRG
jgi:hypothetical protein